MQFLSFCVFTLSIRFFPLQARTYAFHLCMASIGFLRIELTSFLIAPFTKFPSPTTLSNAALRVLLGIFPMASLSFCVFSESSTTFCLQSSTFSLIFLRAFLGFLLNPSTNVLIAPFTLSPSPCTLRKASLTVLLGSLSMAFLSFCDLIPSITFLFLQVHTKALHFSILSLGIFPSLTASSLSFPLTLSPSPTTL